MAIVMYNPPMGVLSFWDCPAGCYVEITVEEPMNYRAGLARATYHSTSEDLVFKALGAFLTCGGGSEVICSRAVRWGKLRVSIASQSIC